eukprot:CAMPEP_0182427494 /NCGR_PEP_ID=MMETSP1167-20130531/17868_1 /TAXON_ID=2988 /ORGANISM="Mallomonas Sp, Strain CCMP3275" /LENGTH=87 /DNA_ID=CAMNT_0024609781 /DNA_START=147 /DNA_END=410 /DNA_ORIENTATION=+
MVEKGGDDNPPLVEWQTSYVYEHLEQGHYGLCFAWLDSGFCPLSCVGGGCPYAHIYPAEWSYRKRHRHQLMVNYAQSLFSDGDNNYY